MRRYINGKYGETREQKKVGINNKLGDVGIEGRCEMSMWDLMQFMN